MDNLIMNPTSEVGLAQCILADEEGRDIIKYIVENKFNHPSSVDKILGIELLYPVFKRYDKESLDVYSEDCSKFLIAALFDKKFAKQNKVLVDVIFQTSRAIKLNPRNFFTTGKQFNSFWDNYKRCNLPFFQKDVMSLEDLKWAMENCDASSTKNKDFEG